MYDENIENLEVEVLVLREKNRILEMRLDDLTARFKRHANNLEAHQI